MTGRDNQNCVNGTADQDEDYGLSQQPTVEANLASPERSVVSPGGDQMYSK